MSPRMLLLALAALMFALADAKATQPDLSNTRAWSNTGKVMISPGGNGPTLAERDLIITVQVLDPSGVPVAYVPFQDIWWDDAGSGDLSICPWDTMADYDTDANGMTTISGAGAGGGWTQRGVRAYVVGVPVTITPVLEIEVNSPDLNGDIVVNLADFGDFALDFFNSSYDFRSDFSLDGVENLADVAVYAAHAGEVCP